MVFIIIWHLNILLMHKILIMNIYVLFSKCLLHDYMPSAMVLSTLIPIPKDNNDIQKSDKH